MKFTRHLTCLLAFALLLPAGAQAKDLHLYVDDGSDHVYLGCFSCSPYDSNSIWNEYGTYGSEYSNSSPWNEHSSSNPVLVDKDGGFYGYFTCNRYRSKRVDSNLMDFLCENRGYIKKHREKAYYKIF